MFVSKEDMYDNSDNKKNILRFYKYYWPVCEKWGDVYNTLGMHIGYYEKNTGNSIEASLNMDKYIGKLLNLNKNQRQSILDAGCGIGGTCIHLGKLYSNVKFTGITIVPDQVELAKFFSKEKNVKNVDFFLKDFNDTSFPNCSFDGVFALESMAHAQNKKKFVEEVHRILKNNGKLVIIGQFQNNMSLNPLIEKLNRITLEAHAFPNLISVKTLSTYLKENGFKDIKVIDISKKVRQGFSNDMLIGIPFFFACILKKIMKPKKYNPLEDTDFLVGISAASFILGLKKTSKHYAVSAVKKHSNK